MRNKKWKKADWTVVIILLALAAAFMVLSQGVDEKREKSKPKAEDHKITYEDYNGKKIGILTSTNMEAESMKYFPDSEYFYFDGYPNMNMALINGKIDAFLGDEPAIRSIHSKQPKISYIKERLTHNQYSFAFRKNDKKEKALRDQFNRFLKKIKEDGTYDEIDAIWFGNDESKKVVDMSGLTGENGTLHVVTTSTDEPFSYIKDEKNVGYDIDVAVRFCRECGYALEIGEVDFGARIPAIQSGRYEFTTTMNVTPEREETVLFSDPVSEGGIVVAVRAEDLDEEEDSPGGVTSFFVSLKESFERNLIRENRWKLILKGLGTTCLITVMAAIFGTIVGFVIWLLMSEESLIAGKICRLFIAIMQGTPMVVLLMILYYIVFTHTDLQAVTVAIIGFALNFGAYSAEIIRSGIDSIDKGQEEAALALGYKKRDTFFRFIFPQAAEHFLPVYRGELINLLKSTSVVGYIAIQDLTKMSDIIRGRTYEAFFPLITTALIYFALAWIIAAVIDGILSLINPRAEKKLIKEGDIESLTNALNELKNTMGEDESKILGSTLSQPIVIEHLRKEYPDVTPLKDVCAQINKGDVISVIGPSGVGKSTLLRCLNQLEEPTSGKVTVDGEVITDPGYDITKLRRSMGMVFQSFNLFNNMNIIDNVTAAPIDLLKVPRDQARIDGMKLLDRVGLAQKAACFPEELSGGQKQRAAIARAIAMNPKIILFDEPTSALDPSMIREVLAVIRELADDGMTMMIVTHEMEFARDISNRIFYMDEGIIYEEGTPEQIFDHPAKEKTRIFIKRLKTTTIKIEESEGDYEAVCRQLELYGKDAMIPAIEVRRMMLVIEELVYQNILGALESGKQGFPVNIHVEHSETENRTYIDITYGGDKYNPLEEGDKLSNMIVKKICQEIEYSYKEGNLLRVVF